MAKRAGGLWAAAIYPVQPDTFGLYKVSRNLHRSQAGARAEADKWLRELAAAPVTWTIVADDLAIGRFRHSSQEWAIVLREFGPPLDWPR